MRFLKFYTLPFLAILLGALFLVPACKNVSPETTDEVNLVSSHPNNIIYDWNELFLEIERYAAGYRPGPAPRAIAHLGLSEYEACITGLPGYKSIASLYGLTVPQVESGKQYHWPSVINASRAYLMPRFFINATPTQLQEIAGLEAYYDDRAKQEVGEEVCRVPKITANPLPPLFGSILKQTLLGTTTSSTLSRATIGKQISKRMAIGSQLSQALANLWVVYGATPGFLPLAKPTKSVANRCLTARAKPLTSIPKPWRCMHKTPLHCLTKTSG